MLNKKELIIFTNHLPFKNGEPYLVDEISILQKEYDYIHVFTYYHENELNTTLKFDDNVVFHTNFNINNYDSFKAGEILKQSFFKIYSLLFKEILLSHKRKYYLKNFKEQRNYLIQNFFQGSLFNEYLKKIGISNQAVFYTYWFDQWTNILSFNKIRFNTTNKLITRVHGFDLDENRRKKPHGFRHTALKSIDSIIAISEYGKTYFSHIYPKHKTKVHCSYLGKNYIEYNPAVISQDYLLVSCSASIPLKRLHLILEILKYTTLTVSYIHFGDGEEQAKLIEKSKELPSNISVEFKGRVENNKVLNFYKNNHVDMLLNVSKYEGLPYSMIEAIAYGIPLMGTQVMGVPEIVNNNTGILLDVNFDVKKAAIQLEDFLYHKSKNPAFRQGIRSIYENKFVAEKNYKQLITDFLS